MHSITAFNSPNNLASNFDYNPSLKKKEIEAWGAANDLPQVTQIVSGSDRI